MCYTCAKHIAMQHNANELEDGLLCFTDASHMLDMC